ncbi:ABC transporter ATP-binding protein [Anaerofustis stercorihominis]|uniref:ABC transporter ATP-binding protein n=1 Tax=Anaerofustis stercorihominis TaxID=214853 RepID=UPI00214C631B|nr:ABC transporter ATP-binding protein [Anaerofustis stercorihominis]MCR2033021.1 ABC transporter ATP-binding protein [Anaerofustis stercorihominis]
MRKPIVEINDLVKNFHTKKSVVTAVEGFSLDVYEGEFIALVGPSGCGKSTILSMLSGLIEPSGGYFEYKKEDPSIGYMLQQDQLFSFRTILDNALLGLEIRGKGKIDDEDREYVLGLLKMYGLESFMHAYPRQLSGGMRQRVALIRTLALKPDILLLDEPFSALDYQTRLAVSEDISLAIRKSHKTAILVTHDLSEAISLADRVIVVSSRPAKVKNIYDINLSIDSLSPVERRKAKEFSDYYDKIWRDLDVHI